MRSVRLSFSLLLLGLAACGNVSLGEEAEDLNGQKDAATGKVEDASADAGHATPITDGATTPITDATMDDEDASDSSDADVSLWVVEDAGTSDTLYTVGGSGPNDVYIGSTKGVYHSKGDGVWTLELLPLPVLSVSADAPGRIFTNGEFGEVDEGNGDGTWNAVESCGNPSASGSPTGPSGEGDVATFGTTLYFTFVGAGAYGTGVCSLTDDETDAGTRDVTWYDDPAEINTVFTSDTGQAYIAGSDATGRAFLTARSGRTWITLPPDPNGEAAPSSAFVGGVALGSSFWVVNDSEVWSGTAAGSLALSQEFTVDRLFGIWSSVANDLWIVANGSHPEVLHLQPGADPATESLPQSPGVLTAIWGSGGSDIYAVGENGAILHRRGG